MEWTRRNSEIIGLFFSSAASNVLILQRCKCADIINCKCPVADKCDVKLADFDSAKQLTDTGAQDRANHPDVVCVEKPSKEIAKIMGTPGNRAPEVGPTSTSETRNQNLLPHDCSVE